MRRRLILLSFLAAFVVALPAQAQDEEPPHILPWLEIHGGGGFTFLLSDVGKYFGDGYHLNAGATLLVKPTFGVQAEYGYTRLGSKQLTIPGTSPTGEALQPISATGRMHYLNFNVVAKPRTKSKAKPYVIGGVGLYRRPVKVTVAKAGYVPAYCYAYYTACWAGGSVFAGQVLDSGSTTGFGINVGAGVFVLMSREAGGGFYVESRYHYAWGPVMKDAQGLSLGKANARFLPITVGLRF